MFIPFLISFREALETALIIGVLVGILKRFGFERENHTVKKAVLSASLLTILSLIIISALGENTRAVINGRLRSLFEGSMMIVSTLFITWALFWLHHHLQMRRGKHIISIHEKIKRGNFDGFFWMVFTLALREGIEIVLFLSTLIFSTSTITLATSSILGIISASLMGYLIYSAAIKINLKRIFRLTTLLLVIFSAGLLVRGIGELTDAHILPQITLFSLNLSFLPPSGSILSEFIKSFFGLERLLSLPQYASYIAYLIAIYLLLGRLNKNPQDYAPKD